MDSIRTLIKGILSSTYKQRPLGRVDNNKIDKINCCDCGLTPDLLEKNECGGHGVYGTSYTIECDCGIATKRISTLNDYDAKNSVISIWNEVMKN